MVATRANGCEAQLFLLASLVRVRGLTRETARTADLLRARTREAHTRAQDNGHANARAHTNTHTAKQTGRTTARRETERAVRAKYTADRSERRRIHD